MNCKRAIAIVAVLSGLLPGAAAACSCGQPTADMMDEADAVFVGMTMISEAQAADRKSGNRVVTFTVMENLKHASSRTVTVQTSASSASCGMAFAVGTRYLIFAYEDEGMLRTGLCSAFDVESELASFLLEQLKVRAPN